METMLKEFTDIHQFCANVTSVWQKEWLNFEIFKQIAVIKDFDELLPKLHSSKGLVVGFYVRL